MPAARSLLDLYGPPPPQPADPLPENYNELYKGKMPVYRRPNQDRLATTAEDQMQYWWAKQYGLPQERP
jgi:hypothetical protein